MKMKKRLSFCLCLAMSLALLAGCGAQKKPAAAPTAEEPAAGLPNPVKASSAEEIAARFGIEMKAPDGAEELSWVVIEADMPLAQLGFSLDGIAYNYRIAKAEAYADISGMYYEWEEISAEEGGGSIRLIPGGAGVYDRFDAEEGVVYSLSMGHGASPETLTETAHLLWGDPSAEELRALLEDVRGRVFPGTSGSSLSAAACAAELADFFCDSGVGPDEVDRVVQSCFASLSSEDAKLFEQQIDGVVSAFTGLTGGNGAGLLDDCGYAAEHFPWDDENVKNCFVALLGSD
jgi:hypothetical protein